MTQAPKPNVNPEAQPWARWVTSMLESLDIKTARNTVNVDAAQAATASNSGQAEQINNAVAELDQGQTVITAEPMAPTNVLLVESASGWTPTGNPFATATIQWDTVETDTVGDPIDISAYQILVSSRAVLTELRRNYNTNPKLENDNSSWTFTGTGVTATPAVGGAVVDFASANTDFSFSQTTGPLALEGDTWNGSLYITVPETYPTVSLRLAERAYDASNVLLAEAYGDPVNYQSGEGWTITTGVLTAPANTAYTKTVLVPDVGFTIPAGARIVIQNALHTISAEIDGYFDGDTPNNDFYFYQWSGPANASESRELVGTDPMTVIGAIGNVFGAATQNYRIENLLPDTPYAVQVRAISSFGVEGEPSTLFAFTTPGNPIVALVPSDPIVETALGIVSVTWDGLLEGASPLPGFSYVFAEFAREGTEDWAQFGQQLRRGGAVTLTGEPVESTVRVRLRSVDTLGNISDPSTEMEVVVIGVTGPDIEANAITANHITAGSISVTHLEPSVGSTLDISANDTINIIAGNLETTNDNLEAMQTVYSFTSTEAVISATGSNFTLALDNDSIEIREGGVAVSWWNSGQMHVPSFVGDTVVLGNHQLEKYGTGTVMRALTGG